MFSGLVNNTAGSNTAICSNYHAIDYCENTRGIDNLLKIYRTSRDIITDAMLNNPQYLLDKIWTHDSPLPLDDDCKCRMGNGNRHSASICAECTNLRRIIDFRTDVNNRPFAIECGMQVGKQLMVTSIDVPRPLLLWDLKANIHARSYASQQVRQDLLNCSCVSSSNLIDMRSITGDPFTIRVLQTMMINRLFEQKNLPHSVRLHTAFICNGTGYMLNDAVNIGSFTNLKRLYGLVTTDDILSIILQLLVILTELSQVNFSHGNPTISALLFDKEPISYRYNNVHIRGQFTMKLADLWQASAKYGNYHYFPHNEAASVALQRSIFMPEIATNNNVYRLTASTIEIYQAMRHIGFPLFVGSFDFYCLFVSLMMDKNVYQTVLSNSKLNNLWTTIWQPTELPIVQQRLIAVHNEESISSSPVDIIRSLWLHCDVLSTMWPLMK